jgi:hypothetical protein
MISSTIYVLRVIPCDSRKLGYKGKREKGKEKEQPKLPKSRRLRKFHHK